MHAFTYADGLALVPLQPGIVPGPAGTAPAGQGDGAVLAVRVDGRRLGTPTVLHLRAGGAAAGVDTLNLRTFVDHGSIWSVAAGESQGVATVHDESTLQWVSGTTF